MPGKTGVHTPVWAPWRDEERPWCIPRWSMERAKCKNTPLPNSLEQAFKKHICIQSSMLQSEESLKLDLKPKDTEMMEKPILSTQEEVQTLFVRRMMASEYEELQGFPPNWTLID